MSGRSGREIHFDILATYLHTHEQPGQVDGGCELSFHNISVEIYKAHIEECSRDDRGSVRRRKPRPRTTSYITDLLLRVLCIAIVEHSNDTYNHARESSVFKIHVPVLLISRDCNV